MGNTLNKDKQIEEMAKDLLQAYAINKLYTEDVAEYLYNAGYRKSSTVALEVIGEVEKIIDKYYDRHIFGVEDLSDVEQEAVMNFSDDITGDLAKLKKKYTKSEVAKRREDIEKSPVDCSTPSVTDSKGDTE